MTVYKKDLMAMQPLNATTEMIAAERADVPREITGWYGGPYRKHPLFTRCQVENNILKVALFFPDALRTGGSLPSYEVFIDRAAKKFITYDRMEDKWREAKVDRLPWPRYIRSTNAPWMSDDDAKAVQTYLGGDKDGYGGVLEYQMMLQEEALERRHKRETDPWDADLSLTPGLPKDWDRWVDKVGIPQNYIFYRYQKRGAKQGHCTYCGKDVPLTVTPRHNKIGRCPCCRHVITFKATGKQSKLSTGLNCVYLLQLRPDGFAMREFWAERFYREDAWEHPVVWCYEKKQVLFDFQLNRRTYYMGLYKNRTYRWIAGMPNASYYSPEVSYYFRGDKPGRVYGKTLPRLLTGPLGRTGLLELLRGTGMVVNPDDYFYVLKERPQLEQLAKSGLPRLTAESILSGNIGGLLEKDLGHGLAKALEIDTQRLGRLRRYNGGQTFLAWLQWEKEADTQVDDDVIQDLCRWDIEPSKISFIMDRMSPLQVRNYLRRQMADTGMDCEQTLTTWQDYLAMAQKLKMDINDPIVYRVKLLRRRHDELVIRCQYKDHKRAAAPLRKKFPDVDKICQSLKKKYEYADETYAIIAPTGIVDILVEGTMLSHCIGSKSERYMERIQMHETYILFLRKVSAPEKPYYTLEIEPDGTVRQKRTKFDRQNSDIEDAKKFLKKWQKVVASRLTGADRKKAAMSRALREQEFEQMRKDNVIIYTGNLAGRRLVDVLTADLMEAAA